MVATRARFIANGEPWRVPKVGTQTSADGTGDVPSYRDVPARYPAPHCIHDRPILPGVPSCRMCASDARPAAPAQPERLTLWDQPIELWSTDR